MSEQTRPPEDDDVIESAARCADADRTDASLVPAMPVVHGVLLDVDCAGGVWWSDQRVLIVSDLHLEKGSSLAARGQLIPPYDTAATLARLERTIARYQPETIIALGDSFHDRNAADRLSGQDLDALAALMAGRNWVWVAGNHDPDPPKHLGGDCTQELAIGPLVFRHEPTVGESSTGSMPDAAGEIAGHLHPAARVRARGRSVRRRCLASDGHRAILPAFGAYAGGLNVRSKAFDGLFDLVSFSAWMLGQDTVYRVPHKRLSPGV
jgi:DNA ligase-associated metallophosphoesterase